MPVNTLIDRLLSEVNEILGPHKNSRINHLGDDVSPPRLKQITALAQGDESADASVRELAFWRWVAFEGYAGTDPRLFKYKQTLLMSQSFATTGWPLTDYTGKHVLEIGCGPYGMIELFDQAAGRMAFDPLNDEYSRLFSNIRSDGIAYTASWTDVLERRDTFDLAICFNVLDHTDDPDEILRGMMDGLKTGGQFLVQVNTVREGFEQTPEHRAMHPSPITSPQIQAMLAPYCSKLQCEITNEPSADNEFWFMGWGWKR